MAGTDLPIVVVGAGAAGIVASIFAASGRRRVVLLERTKDGGRKILISGGGRCNILPSSLDPSRFVTDSSLNTLRKILRSWPLEDQKRFFEKEVGIPLALEAETGKLFPVSNSSRHVRNALLGLARNRGVEPRFDSHVVDLDPPQFCGAPGPAGARLGELDPSESRVVPGPPRGRRVGFDPPEGQSLGTRPDRDAVVRGPSDRVLRSSGDPDHGRTARGASCPHAEAGCWSVRLATGETIEAAAVVLASGGLSVPATGSDGTGLEIVRRLGHTIHETYPALTPLLAQPHPHAELAGVSCAVTLEGSDRGKPFVTRGGFLFTHRGYSGPAVLDISHLAVRSRLAGGPQQPLFVRWTEEGAGVWDGLLRKPGGLVLTLLRRHLPARLADTLLTEARIEPARRLAELRREERLRLVDLLTKHPLPWTGDEGYKKAEVTGGGIALGEVVTHTMESRLLPGLFLCGEILDAFGPIGGYNFLWAWVTGRAAGLGAQAGMK